MTVDRQLFEPARLGPVELRNRIIKAATFEGVTPDGVVTDELIRFHRRVTEGGAAVSTVAYLSVAPEGRTDSGCLLVVPSAVDGLRRLTDAIHDGGAKAAAQIGHAGPVANARSNRATSITPTRMFNPLGLRFSRGADEYDIERITGDYARAASLCVEGGFDVLEVHMGHNYLLSSFLSPKFNRRSDRWGGSIENRARFARKVLDAVRTSVGDDVAVTVKLNMTDGYRGGLSIEDSIEVARMLQADASVDAIELTGGSSLANPMYLFKGAAPTTELPSRSCAAQVSTCRPAMASGSSAARRLASPWRATAHRATFIGTNGPGCTCRPSCSAINAASASGPLLTLPPPSDSGTSIENQPSCAALASHAGSKPSDRSCHSLVAASGSSDSMKRTVVSRKSAWSSVSSSWIDTCLPPSAHYGTLNCDGRAVRVGVPEWNESGCQSRRSRQSRQASTICPPSS